MPPALPTPAPAAGPNGCGKTTLLKALCGLHPLVAGRMQLLGGAAAEGGVLFVPQRPLAAPGSALWQQLCYPGDSSGGSSGRGSAGVEQQQLQRRPADAELLALLQRVGLQHLLDRTGGSFDAPADWGAQLSPGELQRLAVARVLHRCAGVGGGGLGRACPGVCALARAGGGDQHSHTAASPHGILRRPAPCTGAAPQAPRAGGAR